MLLVAAGLPDETDLLAVCALVTVDGLLAVRGLAAIEGLLP